MNGDGRGEIEKNILAKKRHSFLSVEIFLGEAFSLQLPSFLLSTPSPGMGNSGCSTLPSLVYLPSLVGWEGNKAKPQPISQTRDS